MDDNEAKMHEAKNDLTLDDIDREVAEILNNGRSKTKAEVSGSLSLLSRDSLLEARHDLYQLCKNRLCGDDEVEETAANEASWLTEGWHLKERRSQKIMGDDVYELWQYAEGNSSVFPKEILIKKARPVTVTPPTSNTEAASMAVMREQISSLMGLIDEHKVKIQNMESSFEAKMGDMKIEHTKEITQLNGTIASLNKKVETLVKPSTSKPNIDTSSSEQHITDPNAPGISGSSADEASQPTVIVINDTESTTKDTDINLDRVEWPSLPTRRSTPLSNEPSLQKTTGHGHSKASAPDGDGFRTIMSREEIRDMRHNQKKKSNEGNTSSTFPLKGTPKIVTSDLYLKNVTIPMGAINRDIGMSITKHATQHNIRVMRFYIRRNRYVSDVVGCKITVPSTQVQQCKSSNVWPAHITCRDWTPRKDVRPMREGGYGRQNNSRYGGFGNREYRDDDYENGYSNYDSYNNNRTDKDWWDR